jgi:hypothetical protein
MSGPSEAAVAERMRLRAETLGAMSFLSLVAAGVVGGLILGDVLTGVWAFVAEPFVAVFVVLFLELFFRAIDLEHRAYWVREGRG